MPAIRHVLAIYQATSTGKRAIREASAIATEHGAQLTIAVTAGERSRRGCCAISADRWDAVVFEGALQDLDDAHCVVGEAGAHLAIIEGSGPRVIADAAERMRCDLVVVPVARFSPRGGLARALRRRTGASVIGIRRR
jgi:nucleotide-binding universal stress UspA family protein